MKFNVLDPQVGYRNEYLWLPLARAANLNALKNSLTFKRDGETDVHAWHQTKTHLVVPREFIPYEKWKSLSFPIIDRTFDKFPVVEGVKATKELWDEVQHISLTRMLEGGSGVLSLACGKGKTVIALHAWVATKMPGLVVVNTEDLLEQWKARIVEHTNLDEDDIGIYRGSKKDWEHSLTITTLQTLAARVESEELPPEFQNHFGVMVFDEVHILGAPHFNLAAPLGRGIRWGLSATPSRRDGMELLYQYHVGPILYQNLDQDEIPETWFVRTGTELPSEEDVNLNDRTGELNLAKLYTWLCADPERNKKILEWIDTGVRDGRTQLGLTPRVDHVQWLHAQYENQGLKTGMIHGDVKTVERVSALNESELVFAITMLAKQGLDRPELDTLLLMIPVADEGLLRQALGRIQRSNAEKKGCVLIVFEDERIKPMHEICNKMRHILTSLGYPFNLTR